ncbi:malectin domain-containing carbohydrate-binding protein, partial [Terriglobus sp. YAF25]
RYGLRFIQTEEPRVASVVVDTRESKSSGEETDLKSPLFPDSEELPAAESPVEDQRWPRFSRVRISVWVAAITATASILGIVAWVLIAKHFNARLQTTHAELAFSPDAQTAPAPELIMAGHLGGPYIDHDGRSWGGDRFFKGGDAVALKLPYILGSKDSIVYETARQGEFSYDIPVASGKYELRLHFTEANFGPGTYAGRGGDSSRTFSVLLNDQPLLTDFDIFSDAGGNFRAFERVFKGIAPASDGMIHLKFLRGFDQPIVNAIEIDPERGKGMNPIRIVAQDNSYIDQSGKTWQSDRYAIGGLLATHRNPITNTTDPHLYDGERFGHFTYQIPVATGRYTVTLHFSETYFGSESAQYDDSSRVFDVYANGVALLRNYKILQKASGPNKVVSETFRGIEPNAAGLIVLSFVPDKNYACVNTIEVTDETN